MSPYYDHKPGVFTFVELARILLFFATAIGAGIAVSRYARPQSTLMECMVQSPSRSICVPTTLEDKK